MTDRAIMPDRAMLTSMSTKSLPRTKSKSSARTLHASACVCLSIYTCICVYTIGLRPWGLLANTPPSALSARMCAAPHAAALTTLPASNPSAWHTSDGPHSEQRLGDHCLV